MKKKPEIHCWQDYQSTLEMDSQEYYDALASGCGKTCMLPRGHEGEHEWTNDDEIVITFK
jgi:uncharacterized cysteine cluster protein YcgN (CxxCxxCC family)